MILDEMCPCCGVIRYPTLTLIEPCPWCGYDPTWKARRRRHHIRSYRRRKQK